MSNIYHNRPLNKEPQIKITAYVVENEEVFEPEESNIEAVHTHIYKYVETEPVVLVARNKAFHKFLDEARRLLNLRHLMTHPDQPYLGLQLYCEYQINEMDNRTNEPEAHRFYILDGKPFSKKMLLERLADELFLLMRAGAEFNSIFCKDDDGEEYEVVDCDFPDFIQND